MACVRGPDADCGHCSHCKLRVLRADLNGALALLRRLEHVSGGFAFTEFKQAVADWVESYDAKEGT